MSRKLTPRSSLETLRREAKRWHQALRNGDPEALARLERATPNAPPNPTLRDVQHALAREHDLPGWGALKDAVAQQRASTSPPDRETAVRDLLRASEQGDAARVARVLDEYPDVINERTPLDGHSGRRSALHFAMNRMNEDVIALLLARGADPNARDEGDNALPIHFAAERGKLGVVRQLIEAGSDPVGAGDMHELEVIGWATAFNALHRDVADYLLAHGARHTIFSAVAMGATEAIRDVAARAPAELDRRMDLVNHRRRPLHLAVIKRQLPSLVTLLDLGADPECEDDAGLTPLDQAALSGEREMAQRLLERGAALRLPAAVALERTDDVARILGESPDALRPGGRWERLLLRAAEHASGEVVEALIRGGASVDVHDDPRTAVDETHGYTALHAAAFNGNMAAVRVLLHHGANAAARESRYWGTPAGWANYAGFAEVRDVILEGAVDVLDAILFDRNDRLLAVLARDPGALDRRVASYVPGDDTPRPWLDPAWTPLLFALANGKPEAAAILIERGADVTVRDSAGRSVLELAREHGLAGVATLLERRGS